MPKPTAPQLENGTPNLVDGLVSLLDLEQLEANLFRGQSPKSGWKRVFGGQVLAQSLVAAQRTVIEPRQVHSMHAYFLLAGDPKIPIVYEVERARDGGSFTTRRVEAIQNGRPIFVMSASFQKHEDGLDHQSTMPKVAGPDGLPSQEDLLQLMADKIPASLRNHVTRDHALQRASQAAIDQPDGMLRPVSYVYSCLAATGFVGHKNRHAPWYRLSIVCAEAIPFLDSRLMTGVMSVAIVASAKIANMRIL